MQHPDTEFIFIFDRPYNPGFVFAPNVKAHVLHPQARHPFLFYAWFNLTLPRLLNRLKPDLYLSPDGYNCLPWKGKSLIVIHDITFEARPFDVPWLIRKYYRYFFPRFARHASRIATVSEFSRNDIINRYKIPEANIDVVYNGVNERFKPLTTDEIHRCRQVLTDGRPFFLFVGALHPRKNIDNLLKAFDIFKSTDNQNIKLVIAGAKMWWTKDIRNAYEQMKSKNDVIFTGRLGVDDLHQILGSALALTYVSHYEGFGIPILEAFATGTPVITSTSSSMPEVAAGAALLTDPADPVSIAAAMSRLALDEPLRKQLINKGLERKNDFSWQQTAGLLWASILKTVE